MDDVDSGCLHDGGEFRMYADRIVLRDGAEAVVSPNGRVSVRDHARSVEWQADDAGEGYIRYQSDIPVLEAAYNLALKELVRERVRGDVFSTGINWQSLWTRDVAYAIHLGLAIVDAEGCRESLAQRVFRGEIIQDTGTGGGWPVSTDRVVWGIAAWEVFVMTGDDKWLHEACDVLEKTCQHDDGVIRGGNGLVRGESSFLDWREQSYPDWMTPSDIAESCSLSTMVLHAQARVVLSRMMSYQGKQEESNFWSGQAVELWKLIHEKFWVSQCGYFGQFLYGRGYPALSKRPDSLGNLLCVLFGRDAMGDLVDLPGVLNKLPHYSLGIPCFHPQKSMDVPFYHNGAGWPFVEAYYGMAASLSKKGSALAKAAACLVRSALLLGTNKENINLETGRDDGMVLSSNAQLWSIAGMLGTFYKGIFGMSVSESSLVFCPCVPQGWGGNHRLTGGTYCKARFDILVLGEGCKVVRCLVNGVESLPELAADAEGYFSIEVELEPWAESAIPAPSVPVLYDLTVPEWREGGERLSWCSVPNAECYKVFRNGVFIAQTEGTSYGAHAAHDSGLYQVMACSSDGRESFLNEPRKRECPDGVLEIKVLGAEDSLWLKKTEESQPMAIEDLDVPISGVYRVEARYSNGMESIKDGNTCALRSLMIDGKRCGSLVFPHGGEQGDWEKVCSSPGYNVFLAQGRHHIELEMTKHDENSNYFVNECIVRSLRFVRIVDTDAGIMAVFREKDF